MKVLIPVIDHGKKTDLVVVDDESFYRIQVKSIQTKDESIRVENKWQGAKIVYFFKFRRLGWLHSPAFTEANRLLNSQDHIRFRKHSGNSLKAFSEYDVARSVISLM